MRKGVKVCFVSKRVKKIKTRKYVNLFSSGSCMSVLSAKALGMTPQAFPKAQG